jgi:hypothetical protein
VKIEAAVAALTVTAVETFALVVAVATADSNGNGGQSRVATKVLCNEEGGGDGSKSNGNEGGGRATATATMWAMVTETRPSGDERGKCKVSKGYGDGNEGRRRWQQRGSGGDSGYGGGRQHQKLRGRQQSTKCGRRQR